MTTRSAGDAAGGSGSEEACRRSIGWGIIAARHPGRTLRPPRGRGTRRGAWTYLDRDVKSGASSEAGEELLVRVDLGELLQEPLHRLYRLQRRERAAEAPHLLDLLRREELLLLAGARRADVDGGEDPALRELAREHDLHVAGALELLEDHLVHPRAGVDERGRDDGERAALLGLARRAEQPLRALERAGVDAAGERAPGGLDLLVVGAREAGDRVEEDDHVAAGLDEPLR